MTTSEEFTRMAGQARYRKANAEVNALGTLGFAFVALLSLLAILPSAYNDNGRQLTRIYYLCWAIIPFAAMNCSRFYRNRRTYFIVAAVATTPICVHYINNSQLVRRLVYDPNFFHQLVIYCGCIAVFTGALARLICWIAERFVEVIDDPPDSII